MSANANLQLHQRPAILYWLTRGVLLESIRRRELSVVMLFMGLFLAGTIVARIVGAESKAAATFILNLGLTLSWTLSIIMSILMASRQFPDELEQRSLYPLLAKPVSRQKYILGKWLATWLCGAGTATTLSVITLALCPRPKGLSYLLFGQALVLQIAAVGLITIIAIALSIRIPKALTIVVTGLLAFASGPLLNLLRNQSGPDTRSLTNWISLYIPDISRLDIINPLSAAAAPLHIADFTVRLATAAIMALFACAVASITLERKPL